MRQPADELVPPPRAAGLGAWSAGTLALALLLGRAEAPLLGAVAGTLRADLWVDDAQLGALAAALALAQAGAFAALGRLAVRFGTGRLVAAGLALAGAATLLAAGAPLYALVVAALAAAGLGRAPARALAPGLLARRPGSGFGAGLAAAALPAGAALGYGLAGALGPWFGWRGPLAAAGGLSLAVAAAALFAARRGALTPPAGEARAAPRAGAGAPVALRAARAARADSPGALALAGHALLAFALGGLAFWAPAFLERARGVPLPLAAFQLAALALMAALGAPLLARLALLAATPRCATAAGAARAGAAAACAAAAVAGWAAILYPGPAVYLGALAVLHLLLHAALAPAAAALARAPAAAALGPAAALLLGEAAGPLAIGALAEAWNLYWAFFLVPVAALAAAAAFGLAAYAGRSRYRSPSRPSA